METCASTYRFWFLKCVLCAYVAKITYICVCVCWKLKMAASSVHCKYKDKILTRMHFYVHTSMRHSTSIHQQSLHCFLLQTSTGQGRICTDIHTYTYTSCQHTSAVYASYPCHVYPRSLQASTTQRQNVPNNIYTDISTCQDKKLLEGSWGATWRTRNWCDCLQFWTWEHMQDWAHSHECTVKCTTYVRWWSVMVTKAKHAFSLGINFMAFPDICIIFSLLTGG